MENLGAYITSENPNMDTLLKRTWSKVDDGNGPDGVYRSHIITFPSPSKISIYPYNPSAKMKITNLEVAFGVSSWSGNTSPAKFYIQYTNDLTASVNDPTNDSRWITIKSYTSWSHKSGIVNIPVNIICRKIRIVVESSYQSTYYQSTVFRVYGEIILGAYLFQDGAEIKKYTGIDYSILFDGVDDSVAAGTTLITSVSNTFTYEFWALPQATHEIDSESTGGISGTSGQKWAIGAVHGGVAAGAGVSIGTNGISVYEHGDYYMPALLVYPTTINDWVHIAVVYENKQPKLYINGILVKTGLTSGRPAVYPSAIFGKLATYGNFKGKLKDIRIWNYARTQAEIQADMNKTLTGTETGLIGYWKMNEGQGTTINDSSSSGNHATAYGNPTWVTEKFGWITVGSSPATRSMFEQHGMTDLSIIDNNAIQQLTSDTPELLCWTDEEGDSVIRQVNITAVPFPQLLLPVGDIEVGEIESVVLNSTVSGNGVVKVLVSGDSGVNWKGAESNFGFVNIVPTMTGVNVPSPYNVTESSYLVTSTRGWRLFDGDDSTRWVTAQKTNQYVSIDLGSPKQVDKVEIVCDIPDGGPKDWRIEGSNNGSSWTSLLEVSNTSWVDNPRQEFTLTSTGQYRYYRFYILTHTGGDYIQINTLKLLSLEQTGINLVDVSLTGNEPKEKGMTPNQFNSLTKEELATLFPNGKARFAFYLEQEKSTDIVQIDSLKINEKVYTMTPSIESLKVIYNLLESEKPKLYVSRDDGVHWKEVKPDTLTSLEDLPEGTKLRVKAVLSNGQELHALSYSWI